MEVTYALMSIAALSVMLVIAVYLLVRGGNGMVGTGVWKERWDTRAERRVRELEKTVGALLVIVNDILRAYSLKERREDSVPPGIYWRMRLMLEKLARGHQMEHLSAQEYAHWGIDPKGQWVEKVGSDKAVKPGEQGGAG